MSSRPLRDSLHFLGGLVRHPTAIGAVLPSSRRLARALAGRLPLAAGDLVVEFGPGTGPMTRVIAAQLGADARYLGIERDRRFHALLRTRFPELSFAHGSAEDVAAILAEHGFEKAKVIVSGLPFASLPPAVQERIVAGIKAVLHRDGEFRTFQYVHAFHLPSARRFRAMMRAEFGSFTRSPAILCNVPPAYVLGYRP